MQKYNYTKFIEDNTIKCDISHRGGSLKVDLTGLFSQKSLEAIEKANEQVHAGAYQNYLGGGIAGSIQSGRSFDINLLTKSDYKKYVEFSDAVTRYFYDINNGGGDDYMQDNVTGAQAKDGFNRLQKMPVSGY